MHTGNYDFKIINAVKIILKNKDNKILLIQEPEANEWMPLHWGLPGGKPTENESLMETFERKCKTDIGKSVSVEGVMRVYEILMQGRTVLMYIIVATTDDDFTKGESKQYKWVNKEEIEKMNITEMTEFYNKDLLIDFFNGNYSSVPLGLIKTLEFYKMDDSSEYSEWINSGRKLHESTNT